MPCPSSHSSYVFSAMFKVTCGRVDGSDGTTSCLAFAGGGEVTEPCACSGAVLPPSFDGMFHLVCFWDVVPVFVNFSDSEYIEVALHDVLSQRVVFLWGLVLKGKGPCINNPDSYVVFLFRAHCVPVM